MASVRRLLPLLALVLTGCGSKPASEEPKPAASARTAAPPAPTQPDNRRVLVAFGDSLTAGFGAEPGKSYPDYLQKDLDQKNYPWRVVNMGVSGDTSTDGLARLGEVIAQKPGIVILELGANDGLRGIPVDRMRDNLEQMIAALQKAGARVALAGMTLPPNYGPDYIRSFETTYRDLAKRYGLTIIPFLLQGVAGNRSLMQQDGLHPTAEGNRLVARNVLTAVEPLLRQ